LFETLKFRSLPRMLNATQIGRLLARPKVWAWRRVDAGRYGAPVRRGGRATWVPISSVEQAEGVRFTPEQLHLVGIIQNEREAA
jgi:hypothetical protein